jgi:hypothetical protein
MKTASGVYVFTFYLLHRKKIGLERKKGAFAFYFLYEATKESSSLCPPKGKSPK